MTLRRLIDKGRRSGRRYGQFLILGSASLGLLRQSSESLAGRIIYVVYDGNEKFLLSNETYAIRLPQLLKICQ